MTRSGPAPRRPRPTAGEPLHQIRCVIKDLPRFATAPLYRRRHLRWGATDDEVRASMPGERSSRTEVRRHAGDHDQRSAI
jgi:hypothetical protein